MDIKRIIFLVSACFCIYNTTLLAMTKSLPRVQSEKFKELASYANKFLQKNEYKLGCQKNESGFIRINVPMVPSFKSKFQGIKKLRLNYWSPDANAIIREESIHTHPNYFESFIVQGGYTHAVYEEGTDRDQEYDHYCLFKNGEKKSFMFIGQSRLKFMRNESVDNGTVVVFTKDLIHRVIQTKLKTLSLNIVFDDNDEDEKINQYNLYLTQQATLEDVKTTRDVLIGNKSKQLVKEIILGLNPLVS